MTDTTITSTAAQSQLHFTALNMAVCVLEDRLRRVFPSQGGYHDECASKIAAYKNEMVRLAMAFPEIGTKT